jgi:hypothetical protein
MNTAIGLAHGLDGREAGLNAAQQALAHLTAGRPVTGIVFASQEFSMTDVMNGVTSLLPNLPWWGFSTMRILTAEGEEAHLVAVVLIAGADLRAQVHWFPTYSEKSAAVAQQLNRILSESEIGPLEGVLLALDGLNGDPLTLSTAFDQLNMPVAGGMADGDGQAKTYQLAGAQCGNGAMAVLCLGGKFAMGVGAAHGWKPVGVYFKITKSRGTWVQELDGVSPAEAYGRVFGYAPRDWGFPPLKNLIRLYPLALEGQENLPRTPLHVEVNGSLRMNIPLLEGQQMRLMVGDSAACLEAARLAARKALQSLGKARPGVALVFIDKAWRTLFELNREQIVVALQAELGDLPMVCVYTLGQLSEQSAEKAMFANMLISVTILGETTD